jgi:tetratricopeptide (TPR) repeat protein
MIVLIRLSLCVFLSVVLAHGQSNDLRAKLDHGKELMAAGRFEEAIPIYRAAVQALPNNPGPIMNLGLALHLAGHEREALSQFQTVLKLEPSNLPARLFLGAAYLGMKEPERAIEPLTAVVRAQPGNREARLFLGQGLLSLERFQAAAEQFDKLSELDPRNPRVWNGLGQSYEALVTRSVEALEKVAPESAYWLVIVAESLSKTDQYQRAFYFYREALAKMPGLHGVHAMLAEIYRKDGHPDWAAVEQEREHKSSPLPCGNTPISAAVGPQDGRPGKSQQLECDFWAGRYRQVVASSNQDQSAEAIFWRTRAYNEMARQAFDHLARLPASGEAHELMAKLHFTRRNYVASIKEWREALKVSPANSDYRRGLAVSLSASGDYEASRQLLKDLIQQSPHSPELNYWLGFTLLGLEKPEAAIPFLEKGVEGDPLVLPGHRDLARAYLRVGQTEKAIPHLKSALPIDEEGALYYQLAQAYRKSGQKELEKEALKKFQQIQASATAESVKFKQQLQITPP